MEIREMLDKTEILAQLAEEAAELAQAALKLRRAIDGENPTPKSISECEDALDEEIADVELCLLQLGFASGDHINTQALIMCRKEERWLSRLRKRRKGNAESH